MSTRIVLSVFLLAGLAVAEEAPVGMPFWVSTPSAATTALHQAVEAVGRGDFTKAARSLQIVYDRYADNFVTTTRAGRYIGARRQAGELLLTMPEEVGAEYERLFGPAAEEALRTGLAARDRRKILEVVKRFESTRAGLKALLALADSALARGHPAEARLLLARLSRVHPATGKDPAVVARARLAADRDHAQGGAPPPGEGNAPAPPEPHEGWALLGGNAARNRVAIAPAFREEKYHIDVHVGMRDLDRPPQPTRFGRSRRRPDYQFEHHWENYLPLQPVVSRGFLIFSDGRRVAAHNLYTDQEEWAFETSSHEFNGRTNLSGIFSPVVADGIVYVSLEVPTPFTEQTLNQTHITYYIPSRRLYAFELATGRLLWSHDDRSLASKPPEIEELLRKLTITGAPLVRGDRIYVGACYSEGTFHSLLTAFDRHSGELLYTTRISQGQQELNLFGRQLQECVPTPVAEADGVLYYGTNLGIVAAVDALLGTPLWASAYPVETIPSTYFWYEAPRRWPRLENGPPVVAGDLLLLAPADGTHLLAIDRDTGSIRWKLHYSDSMKFSFRTLYGADADRAYVGGDEIAAVWLRDGDGHAGGDMAWVANHFDDGEEAVGRGLLAVGNERGAGPGTLWAPTQIRIFVIDRRTGLVLKTIPREGTAEQMPVNLVWADGALVSAALDLITVRYEVGDVLARMRDRIQAAPDRVGPLLQAGDLYLAQRDVAHAIEYYGKSRRRAQNLGDMSAEMRARAGLYRAYFVRAKEEFPHHPKKAMQAFEAAVRNAPRRDARLKARFWLEGWFAARRRKDETEARLKNLAAIEREHVTPSDDATEGLKSWAIRRRALIHLQLGQVRRALQLHHRVLRDEPGGQDARRSGDAIRLILRDHGRVYYQRYENQAADLYAAALRSNDLEAIERGISLYPNAAATPDAILRLAEAYLAARRPADAIRTLQRFLLGYQQSSRLPEALLLRFRALHSQRSFGPAFNTLRLLKDRYGGQLVRRADGAEVPARQVAEAWLTNAPYPALARSSERRDLEPPLINRTRGVFGEYDNLWVPPLVGIRPAALADALFLRGRERTVLATDARRGTLLYEVDFGDSTLRRPLVLAGDRLFGVTKNALSVFDARNGRAVGLRRLEPGTYGERLVEHEGQVFLLTRTPALDLLHVSALNPDDGSTLWRTPLRTSQTGPTIKRIMAWGPRLMLISSRPVRITVLSTTSGLVENRILVREEEHASVDEQAPALLHDGRLLLPVVTRRRGPRFRRWEKSLSLVLVDPSRRQDRAEVWSYSHAPFAGSWGVRMTVIGDYALLLSDKLGAVVLDLREGRPVRTVDRLALGAKLDVHRPRLGSYAPSDSLLLLLTRSAPGLPAHLAAFDVPSLKRRYAVKVADRPNERAEIVESHGVLTISLEPDSDEPAERGRIRLYDPLTGRMLQEIPIRGPGVQWHAAQVQNGYLVVTTNTSRTYVWGPK